MNTTTETRPALDEIAKAIAGYIDGATYQQPAEAFDSDWRAVIDLPGRLYLLVTRRNYGVDRGKLEVSAHVSGIKPGTRFHDRTLSPTAKMNGARHPAALAADIKRRIIDPAGAFVAKVLELEAQRESATKRLEHNATRLRRHPGLRVKLEHDADDRGEVSASEPYMFGRFYDDGSVDMDRLGRVSAEQFDMICDALGWSTAGGAKA